MIESREERVQQVVPSSELRLAKDRDKKYSLAIDRLKSQDNNLFFPPEVSRSLRKENLRNLPPEIIKIGNLEYIIDVCNENISCVYVVKNERKNRRVTAMVYVDTTSQKCVNLLDLQPEVPVYMGEDGTYFLEKMLKSASLDSMSYAVRVGSKARKQVGKKIYINIPERNPQEFHERIIPKMEKAFAFLSRIGVKIPGDSTHEKYLNFISDQKPMQINNIMTMIAAPPHEYGHAIELFHFYRRASLKYLSSVLRRKVKEMIVRDECAADVFAIRVLEKFELLGIHIFDNVSKEELQQYFVEMGRRS